MKYHLITNIIVVFIGAVLLFAFGDLLVELLGFIMVVYGTFSSVFHLTVDEHVRL